MMNLILEAENVFKNGTKLDLFSKLTKLRLKEEWQNHFYFMLVNAIKEKHVNFNAHMASLNYIKVNVYIYAYMYVCIYES